jgi:hypothetical protein
MLTQCDEFAPFPPKRPPACNKFSCPFPSHPQAAALRCVRASAP